MTMFVGVWVSIKEGLKKFLAKPPLTSSPFNPGGLMWILLLRIMGGLGVFTGGLTRVTILLFKLVVASVCLVVNSVTTLKFARRHAVTPSISIWHLLRSVPNVRCPASFDWWDILVDPSFVTSPSIFHGGLLWYWALNHGGPCSGEPSRAWWIFFRWYRVSQSSMPRVASLGRFVS